MVEEQMARIEEAMTKMLEEVDKSYIRVLQGRMYKCAATCCDDKDSSMRVVQRCIENCGNPLEKAQHFVRDEFQHLQDRLQRCVMTCNDTIMDKVGADTNVTGMSRYTGEFESCARKCVDSHINLIPEVLKKIKEVMKREKYL